MAIKIDCPRCKARLQVSDRLADRYVNCPHCKGRMWVAKDAAADGTPAETEAVAISGSAPAAPPASRTKVAPSVQPLTSPASGLPSAPRANPPMTAPAAPVPAVVPGRKVARFITAEAADSTLRLAADGKLPELHLEEGAAKEKPAAGAKSMNPLVLFGLLTLSVVLSVGLVMIPVGSPPASGALERDAKRQMIEAEYFGSGAIDNARLEPYQVLLRDAQRAYSHGDYKTERACYGKVLNMLRAERGPEEKGLTGSRSKDDKLREAIAVLLSGG